MNSVQKIYLKKFHSHTPIFSQIFNVQKCQMIGVPFCFSGWPDFLYGSAPPYALLAMLLIRVIYKLYLQLDAGVDENIQLVSRNGDNILIVSFAELRKYLENSFNTLQQTQSSESQQQFKNGASPSQSESIFCLLKYYVIPRFYTILHEHF